MDEDIVAVTTLDNTVEVWNIRTGDRIRSIGSPGSGPCEFNHPWGIAPIGVGVVAVADRWNKRLQIVDVNSGTFLQQAQLEYVPYCLSLMRDGKILVGRF